MSCNFLRVFSFLFFILSISSVQVQAQPETKVKVGVATILSGDLALLGQNLVNTIETYKAKHLRHPIEFYFQDAKKGSADGLKAYQYLINVEKVDLLIGGTTSNGTIAASSIINQSKTVLITPLTGGSNIDQAGPYVFRIGNSDVLNGQQQAEYFIKHGLKRVALVTEETEYTNDIATHFRKKFEELGGELVYDETFLPDNSDFRTQIVTLLAKKPQALFMSTQTGLAFGIFIKQLNELKKNLAIEIHTNFLAASNPDARKVAGASIYGVHFMAPAYNRSANSPYQKFLAEYLAVAKTEPAIPFHTAGTVDALNMLQDYLDTIKGQPFQREGFQQYLLSQIKNYQGLMGTYSFDAEGNADLGFEEALIQP
jgi:branched-chain amino acid transport system substrate-binding protein